MFKDLRTFDVNPKEVLNNEVKFKSDQSEIRASSNQLEDQKNITGNFILFCNFWEKIIQLFRGYSILPSEAKYKAKHGKGHKMFQRLLIALAQLKLGNTSENVINEIHQIIYSCIKLKKILKKHIIIQWFH